MLRTVAAVLSFLAINLAGATDTPSPNKAIPKPACNPNTTVSLRYSSELERLYVESSDGITRGGCITLTEIWNSTAGIALLYPVSNITGNPRDNATGTWLLTESLWVKDGITLQVHGTSVGGDTDELRLLSTNETRINILAHGGSLDFVSTKVFSWDTNSNTPDHDKYNGRSYVRAVSEVITDHNQTCDGRAKDDVGEARMDIEDSEMAYLGYYNGESYGLTWKVRGLCKDFSNIDIFDDINVYGNIYDSDIHHNHFGVYTYGHQQGDWRRNKMHDNTAYGFDPHDDSDLLTIHDNEVYNNGNHGIIASKRCNGVSIQGNEVYGGGYKSVGIFLHRSSDDAIVKGNYVHGNGDAGMALMEAFNATVSDNVFEDNKYGVRLSVGSANNVFADNNITGSTKYNIYSYEGSDDPWVAGSGRMKNNTIKDNTIVGGSESIKLASADSTEFIDNTFKEVAKVIFRDATGTVMRDNAGLDDAELSISDGACFDYGCDAGFHPRC